MAEPIGPTLPPGGISPISDPSARARQAQAPGEGFTKALGGLVEQVNRLQHEASEAITQFAAGDGENLHEVMLAVNKAELSFKFLMEARNKLVEAYQEVMRMQL